MDVPLVQLLVYAQPLVWILLYRWRLRVPTWLVIVGGVIAAAWVWVSGLNYGFYTNGLLIFYILSVTYVAYHYRDRPHFQPISLAFIIVFVNSFYWEFPLHVADFLELDSFGVVAVQSLHLWPVPFLMKQNFDVPKRWWYTSVVAWAVIALFSTFHMMGYIVGDLWTWTMYLCRAIGLYTLLWILRYPGYGDKLIFKVKDLIGV